jgi:hypothetical protein
VTAVCLYRYEKKSVDFVKCLTKAKPVTGKNGNKLFTEQANANKHYRR